MQEPFRDLAELCERLEKISRRNDKIKLAAEYFKHFNRGGVKDAIAAAYLLTGFSTGVKRLGLNVGPSTLNKVLKEKHTPLFSLPKLTVSEVWETIQKVERLSGPGSAIARKNLLAGLFSRADELERRWLIRMVSGEMRHGFNMGLLLEAFSELTSLPAERVRVADMLLGSLDELVKRGLEGTLETATLKLFKPVKPMLAEFVYSADEAVKKFETPLFCEAKIDGIRVQFHKKGGCVRIFSRGLRELTMSMPDLVEKVAQNVYADEAILDGEAYCVDQDGKPLPFQETMRRVGKEKDIYRALSSLQLVARCFDILYVNGQELWNKPLCMRREALERWLSQDLLIGAIKVRNAQELNEYFNKCVAEGYEGVVLKSPEAPYVPGRRGSYWLKMKPADTLDVVVVAAEWGHGRRRGWLSNYHLAVIDDRTGDLVPVGKTFKGLTDQEFEKMTESLLKIKRGETEWGVIVEPKIVLEVEYNDVQKSPHYSSGYALRFARVKRIREDKDVSEADTLSKLEKTFMKNRRVYIR